MHGATEIEQRAAEWLAKRESGTWSSDDQLRLDQWVAASTANRIALIRLETVWGKADRLRAAPVDVLVEPVAVVGGPGSRGRRPFWGSRLLPTAVAAAVVAAVSIPSYHYLVPAAQEYATPVGGFQQLPLTDGSRVELNTDTLLDVSFDRAERRVKLTRGEAFFKVAKDHSRPFVVQAGRYRVVAVGTAFTVRMAGDDVDVVVTEGTVRVERPAGDARPTFVSAGQTALVTNEIPVVRPTPAAVIESVQGWRDGMLVFENRPLGEVAAEFNRYNQRKLIVDPSATDVVIDGTFRATNLDAFVRLLHEGFGVRAAPAGDDEIVLRKI